MFKNVGKKISSLAFLFCIVGIVCSIISGVSFAMSYNTVNQPMDNTAVLPDGTVVEGSNIQVEYTPSSPVAHIIAGILIAVAGSLVSWVSSLSLYGFGHLITKTAENSEYIKKLAAK